MPLNCLFPRGKFRSVCFYSCFIVKKTFFASNLLLCRLPFDWKCPSGYLVAIVLQWFAMIYACFSIMIVITTGIASYLYLNAVTKDIKCILKPMNKRSNSKNHCKHIHKHFIDFIDLHSAIKQLSNTLLFNFSEYNISHRFGFTFTF